MQENQSRARADEQADDLRDQRALQVERRVDDLQSYLRRAWVRLTYDAALCVSFIAVTVAAVSITPDLSSGLVAGAPQWPLLWIFPVAYGILVGLDIFAVDASVYVERVADPTQRELAVSDVERRRWPSLSSVRESLRAVIPAFGVFLLVAPPILHQPNLTEGLVVGFFGGVLAPIALSLLNRVYVLD